MLPKVDSAGRSGTIPSITIRCPMCRHLTVLESIQDGNEYQCYDQAASRSYGFGGRKCNNDKCRALIFFVVALSPQELVATFPAERLDFDSTNLPAPVLNALEEAIVCHANQCYVASAIMVRKTLEVLCHDQEVVGPNLKARLEQLKSKVVLPQALIGGLDNLRWLGNDAAHVELEKFSQIGKDEVETAVQVTKEVLKAVYQYAALMDRLNALKK